LSLETIATLALTTFALGVVLGFVGAGGAGLAVALLTSVFNLSIHEAIGTALAAMFFVTISGAISHFREGNVAPRIGLTVGLSGMVGALIGANIGLEVPAETLKVAAGLALWVLAVLVWMRTRFAEQTVVAHDPSLPIHSDRQFAASIGLGVTGGAASAFFGIGMAPYLQLGLLTFLKLPLRQTVGTTMLTLVFVSASGALVLARHGDVSTNHLIGTVIGLASGSYIGARYTRRAPRAVLRAAVVTVPIIAGAILLFL
jgi:uncharacterized protein